MYEAAHVSEIIGGLRQHEDTKTSLRQQDFYSEFKLVCHEFGGADYRRLYALRRAILYVLNGLFGYVLGGLMRRLRSRAY
jgi:hypothetical protein